MSESSKIEFPCTSIYLIGHIDGTDARLVVFGSLKDLLDTALPNRSAEIVTAPENTWKLSFSIRHDRTTAGEISEATHLLQRTLGVLRLKDEVEIIDRTIECFYRKPGSLQIPPIDELPRNVLPFPKRPR